MCARACWESEFACFGFSGQNLPTLTSAAVVATGTAWQRRYRCVPSSWWYFKLFGSGLNSMDWNAGSAEVNCKIPLLSLPLLCLFPAAVRMYWHVPAALPNQRRTPHLWLGWGKAWASQQEHSQKVWPFSWLLGRVVCLQAGPARIHHRPWSPAKKKKQPSTDKAVHICSVYYAGDADWH